jgi:lipid II:glycine glycyltransferase (peptidoglycan interpeptide bridge formation enzyme)
VEGTARPDAAEHAADRLAGDRGNKTRYNIGLAYRRGVVVDEGTAADLDEWYAIYLETVARNQLVPMPFAHFSTMLDERAEGSASPVQTRLLLARHEGKLLAGMMLAIAPSRATYLYGASTREHRDLMASSALQWAAIRLAKNHGCTDYDLFGAAPRSGDSHALAGVHRFKVGFGGRLVHREGCWDFPFDDATYAAWRSVEAAQVVRRGIG